MSFQHFDFYVEDLTIKIQYGQIWQGADKDTFISCLIDEQAVVPDSDWVD